MATTGTKLLIVEDDSYMRKLLVKRAQLRHSIHCQCDGTGEYCIELATAFHPDVILLDMNLPKISGFGILRELKKHQFLKDIPVIILTSHTHPEILQQAFELGATAYFPKTSRLEDVFEMVNSISNTNRISKLH